MAAAQSSNNDERTSSEHSAPSEHGSNDRILFRRIKRTRMSQEQKRILELEYQRNPRWTTNQISSLARRLGINHTKVYKWCYDRR